MFKRIFNSLEGGKPENIFDVFFNWVSYLNRGRNNLKNAKVLVVLSFLKFYPVH